jgi:fructokinase
MRKVIGIGETGLDIIFRNDQPISSLPGGSTYNACISLGRVGVNVAFISETGDDHIGTVICNHLRENGVDCSGVNICQGRKTSLSLAFLDQNNDANYIFYKDHDNDQLELAMPQINTDDILLLGSYYALNPIIRPQVESLLRQARDRGAIIYYDVNFRKSHAHEVLRLRPNLIENLEYADIVRGSSDDFRYLYNNTNAEQIYKQEISFYCKNFIFTSGAKPIEVFARENVREQIDALPTDTVSTIGAGDNFNAGFIYGLIREGVTHTDLQQGIDSKLWQKIVGYGQLFSQECCKSINNYISTEFGEQLKN